MLFRTGPLTESRGIATARDKDSSFDREVMTAYNDYINGRWGNLPAEDKEANETAVKAGNQRIIGRYSLSKGDIYIITEWDRSYTTILFCSEY